MKHFWFDVRKVPYVIDKPWCREKTQQRSKQKVWKSKVKKILLEKLQPPSLGEMGSRWSGKCLIWVTKHFASNGFTLFSPIVRHSSPWKTGSILKFNLLWLVTTISCPKRDRKTHLHCLGEYFVTFKVCILLHPEVKYSMVPKESNDQERK